MPPIEIRPAVESDAPAIFDLICQLAEYERLSHCVTGTEERIRTTLFGPQPAAEVLMASFGADTVGFALYFSTYSTFLAQPGIYLEDLYVKPEHRGKGVGSALLERLAQIAVERDCGRIEWGVLNWNEPSIQFYKNLGAEPQDEWTKYRLSGDAIQRLATRTRS